MKNEPCPRCKHVTAFCSKCGQHLDPEPDGNEIVIIPGVLKFEGDEFPQTEFAGVVLQGAKIMNANIAIDPRTEVSFGRGKRTRMVIHCDRVIITPREAP